MPTPDKNFFGMLTPAQWAEKMSRENGQDVKTIFGMKVAEVSAFRNACLGIPWEDRSPTIPFTKLAAADVQKDKLEGIDKKGKPVSITLKSIQAGKSLATAKAALAFADEVDDYPRGEYRLMPPRSLHSYGTALDIKLNTKELEEALADFQQKTKQHTETLIKKMSLDHAQRLAKMIQNGKAVVTSSRFANSHHDFPSFELHGKVADFGGNAFFDFDDEDSPKTKNKPQFKMKDPNNNPVVHEIARELVASTTGAQKTEASLEGLGKALTDAIEARGAAYEEADRVIREAHEKAEQIRLDAIRAEEVAREKKLDAAQKVDELKAEAENAKAALAVARQSASEDIELTIGSHVVTAYELEDGGTDVSIIAPCKVAKKPA